MLLEFVLFVAPGGGFMYYVYRFVKAKELVSVARVDAARAGARLEAAQEASAVAQGTAREALAQTGEALSIARTIELVDEKITGLTNYLVSQIEGAAPQQAGRHSRPELPGAEEFPAIGVGRQEAES
jgi:hypothetical protein